MAIGPVNVSVDAVLRKRVRYGLVLLALRRDQHLNLATLGRDDGQSLEVCPETPRSVKRHVLLAFDHRLAPLHPALDTPVQAALGALVALWTVVDLVPPNNITVTDLAVMGSEIGGQGIGVLVGMDVITFGDFAVSFKDGLTRFSFRVPSLEHVDFVGIAKTEASDLSTSQQP